MFFPQEVNKEVSDAENEAKAIRPLTHVPWQRRVVKSRPGTQESCFLGKFIPKTGNYCLKNRALGFPGGVIFRELCRQRKTTRSTNHDPSGKRTHRQWKSTFFSSHRMVDFPLRNLVYRKCIQNCLVAFVVTVRNFPGGKATYFFVTRIFNWQNDGMTTMTFREFFSAPDCCFAKKPGNDIHFRQDGRVSISFCVHLSPKCIQKCICMCQGLNY